MKKILFKILEQLITLIQRVIAKVRKEMFLARFQQVGTNLNFSPIDSHFSAETIKIGKNVFIGERAWCGGNITIGNNVMFGPRPMILAANHIFAIQGKSPRFIQPAFPGQNEAPVVIEDEVWCGANVTILGNVTIGIGAIVGASSVVTNDIPPFTIAVGNPCRPVRKVFDDEHLLSHLAALGYPPEFSAGVVQRRNALLSGKALPVIDRTDEYTHIHYAPLP